MFHENIFLFTPEKDPKNNKCWPRFNSRVTDALKRWLGDNYILEEIPNSFSKIEIISYENRIGATSTGTTFNVLVYPTSPSAKASYRVDLRSNDLFPMIGACGITTDYTLEGQDFFLFRKGSSAYGISYRGSAVYNKLKGITDV